MDDETHFFVRLCQKCINDEKTQIKGIIDSYNKFLHLDKIMEEFQEKNNFSFSSTPTTVAPSIIFFWGFFLTLYVGSSTRAKKKVNYREEEGKKEYFIDHQQTLQNIGQIVDGHCNRNKLFLTLLNTNRTFINDNNDNERLLSSDFCRNNKNFSVS